MKASSKKKTTWVILDGFDAAIWKYAPKSFTQLFPPHPVWLRTPEFSGASAQEFRFNSLHQLLSGEHLQPRQSLSNLMDGWRTQSWYSAPNPEPLHVFGVLSQSEQWGGLTFLINVLERLQEATPRKIYLHLICPHFEKPEPLLPIDCLFQLERWMSQARSRHQISLASFAGSQWVFQNPLAYFQQLQSPEPRRRFQKFKTQLQTTLSQGFEASNLPLYVQEETEKLNHQSQVISACRHSRLSHSISQFFIRSSILLTLDHPSPSFELMKTLKSKDDLTLIDLSESKLLQRLLNFYSDQNSTTINVISPTSVQIIFDDRLYLAQHSGLSWKLNDAFDRIKSYLGPILASNVPQNVFVSGGSPSIFSPLDWSRHPTPPGIPLWTLPSNDDKKELSQADLSAAIPLLCEVTGL